MHIIVVVFVGEKSFLHLLLAVFAGRTRTRITSATVVTLDPGSVPNAVFAVRISAAAAAKRAWCTVFATFTITATAPIKQIASPRCRVGAAGFANRFAASLTVFPQ